MSGSARGILRHPSRGEPRPGSGLRPADPLRHEGRRGGFVLAFVVFMLFAITVASATGYLVVTSEFRLARYSGEGAEALTVARAGLERFVAEQLGAVDDSASYALGDGVAVVTSRKLFARDSVTDLYYIRSDATVADIAAPGAPARRVVGGYAVHRRRPLAHHAAVMIAANTIAVGNGGQARGIDANSSGDCPGGGASPITGAIATANVTEGSSSDVEGSPEFEIWTGGWSAMLDSIGLRWDILTDPEFPFEFENSYPNFASIPADSFPVIRYTGWMGTGMNGRGVLIVDGVFDPWASFTWDGIVIARHVDDVIQGRISGMLIAGLNGPNMYSTVDFRTDTDYHSCFVYAANESLSYLELLPNTIFEVN